MGDAQAVEFTKMQGTGNDFIVLDNRTYQFSSEELSEGAAAWCPRRYGVGADGLLALDTPVTSAADYRMHYVNADGSRATMCGNGARCLARFAQQVGVEKSELAFDTDAGLYHAVLTDEEGLVRLFVPEVQEIQSEVALDRAPPDGIEALYCAYAGTEHLVAFVEDVASVPVRDWGERLRRDSHFAPTGTNANFVQLNDPAEVSIRTYEKGVEDETLSCGTGVLAAAVVVERTGRVKQDPITVRARGGTLEVGTAPTDRGSERYLEGPAETVYRGRLRIARSG